MRSAIKEIGKGATIVWPIVEFGMWIADRVRARRAARKAGKLPTVDPKAVKEGIDRALELSDTVRGKKP